MTFVTYDKNGVLNHTATQTSRLNSMYVYGLYIDLDHFWLYNIIRSCVQMSVRVGLKEVSVSLKILMFQTSGEFIDKLSVY